MEKKKLVIDYVEYGSLAEMPDDAKRLMECAMESAHKAYAPYSKFHVGAAVLLADGTMVQGSNQENIAYPSGLCAERTALFSASAQYPKQAVVALAVVGHFEGDYTEASPCGACRQVMEELLTKDCKIILTNLKNDIKEMTIEELLPYSFS